MCETWFTSDLHINHVSMVDHIVDGELVDGWRNFSTLGDMNATLIRNWNHLVDEDDVVYVLGDAVMGKREDSLHIFSHLNGIKLLVPGNHDYCWWGNIVTGSDKQIAKVNNWAKKYVEIGGFDSILDSEVRLYFDEGNSPVPYLDLCHFPAKGFRENDDRYPEHIPAVSNTYNLHGHVHLPYKFHDGNQIHIGVDGWDYHPVNLEQIWDLIEENR